MTLSNRRFVAGRDKDQEYCRIRFFGVSQERVFVGPDEITKIEVSVNEGHSQNENQEILGVASYFPATSKEGFHFPIKSLLERKVEHIKVHGTQEPFADDWMIEPASIWVDLFLGSHAFQRLLSVEMKQKVVELNLQFDKADDRLAQEDMLSCRGFRWNIAGEVALWEELLVESFSFRISET